MSLAEALRAEAAAVESQLALLERLLFQLRAAAVTAELLEASDTVEEVAVPVLSIEDLAEMGRESARQFARRKEELLLDAMRDPDCDCDAPVAEAVMGAEVAHQLDCASLDEAEPEELAEFECHCGREFSSKQGLTMHVRRAHEGYNPRAGTPNKPKAKPEPSDGPVIDGVQMIRGRVFICADADCSYLGGDPDRLRDHVLKEHRRAPFGEERTPREVPS